MKNFPLNVMYWVKTLFPTYRKEQKGIEWGELYNQYKDKSFNPNELEKRANSLMQDDEVTSKKRRVLLPYHRQRKIFEYQRVFSFYEKRDLRKTEWHLSNMQK